MRKQIILFLLISSSCFSQVFNKIKKDSVKYKAIYSVTFQPDSTNTASKKSGFLFTLLLGKNYSMYADNKKYLLDSIMRGVNQGKIKQQYILANLYSMPKPVTNVEIIKSYSQKKITFLDNISSRLYKYDEKLDIINWKIKSETKNISGYKCQKAIGKFAGRSYITWFTNEIPISDGPYKFNGLPGLIIKISDTKNYYDFLLKKFYAVKNVQINLKPVDTPIYLEKKKFYKLRNSYFTNPIPIMESEGAVINQENKRKIIEVFKKKKKANNNSIERIIN